MDCSFGTSDAYSDALRAQGHEAHELVVNALPLQLAWAREHGFRPLRRLRRLARRDWRLDLLAAQLEWFEPDVVYVQDLHLATHPVLDVVRPRARLLAGQIASALPEESRLPRYDLLVSSFPHYVERFRRLGIDAAYLPLAFDARVLERVETDGPRAGAVFVGALGGPRHATANAVLEEAARHVPVDFHGFGADDRPPDSPLRTRYRGEAWGLDLYRVLARAAIALNRHIDVAEGRANNARLFEATGVGALVLTEAAPNLDDLFEPGVEVATYADADELVAKLRLYLADEDARAAVAAAGQRRTLAEHTWPRRIAQLVELIGARL